MKKVVVCMTTFLLIIVSIIIIFFMDDSLKNSLEVTTSTTENRAKSSIESINFSSYTISSIDYEKDTFVLADVKFTISKNDLFINGIFVDHIDDLYYDISIYNKNKVVLFNTNSSNIVEMLIYDMNKRKLNKIDKVDGKRILLNIDNYPEDDGLYFAVTELDENNYFNYNGKKTYICKCDNPKYKIAKNIRYKYDMDKDSFTDAQDVSTISISDYVGKYVNC